MTEELDPRAALALVRDARVRMAERAATPVWYAPLYGLFCGLLVAGAGLPQPWGLIQVAVALIAVGLLYHRWTQISGLVVNGYRAGATRVIAIALTFALVGLALGGLALREHMGLVWGPIACGIVGALIAAFASAAWDRAWREEIRRGAGQ
jgi:hypothetical protein